MIKQAKNLRYNNIQKGKLQKYTNKLTLNFGTLGLKALESGYITSKQLESARQTILKKMNRKGRVWTKIAINKPVTKKPLEVRMGKGKGSLSHRVARVKGGSILFELCGVSKKTAILILRTGGSKLPIKTGLFY
jgi:large subunit ribosomal protein L16